MTEQGILTLLGTVGFPSAFAFALLLIGRQTVKENTAAIVKLKETLDRICEKLGVAPPQ